MARKYATKQEIFNNMIAEAKKAERVAIQMLNSNSPAANHIWAKAQDLFAKANTYSIRWNVL